ncbi:MAG: S8 family serine peptidase [bacterium]|nr:S8 family serine peptidase [bacterium]
MIGKTNSFIKQTTGLYLLPVVLTLIFLIPALHLSGDTEQVKSPLSPYKKLISKAEETGYTKVIIKLAVGNIEELTANSTRYKNVIPGEVFPQAGIHADLELRESIDTVTDSLLHRLNGLSYRLNHTYHTVPYLALDASPAVLGLLPTLPEVLDIQEDKRQRLPPVTNTSAKSVSTGQSQGTGSGIDGPMLDNTVSIIGADTAWADGYTGSGWYVAILDTGIRKSHQFFDGKSIVEACFSSNNDCPNGNSSMTGTGAAAHYESSYDGYDHGTHVSGIAAGQYGSLAGVAKDSSILAVQVFSRFGSEDCGGYPCVMAYNSDQLSGLEHVYSLRSSYSIAAANMSIGGGSYSAYCDTDARKAAIDNLRAAGIATVIATGNDGYCDYISAPACISSAVAVGASLDSDSEASFNNWHATLQDLFAPGVSIYSSTGASNSSYESWNGTSMATPHVTGAWALLKHYAPNISVTDALDALVTSGTQITTGCGSDDSLPRINVDEAIAGHSPSTPPTIALNRTSFYFSAVSGGATTSSQYLRINNTGGGTLNWTATPDSAWLTCTSSGSGSGVSALSVNATGQAAGTYTGNISVAATGATNTPQTVSVTLTVINASAEAAPFGSFSTPIEGSAVSSSIPVTGWALDDIGIDSVKIYRQNGTTLNYIGDALFIEGARPDVEAAYPGYPANYKAGWGYMLLTHFLPDGGNGSYTLTAIATDLSNKQTSLGSINFTCDNDGAVKPFGAIDTPTAGGDAGGAEFRNVGWILTPTPNTVPVDGHTIDLYIDGVRLAGHPAYGLGRPDIAALFPGYNNSDGALAYFTIDTTGYDNGVHTIFWTAMDDGGNSDGIGSRYFTVQNSGSDIANSTAFTPPGLTTLSAPPALSPVYFSKGYSKVKPNAIHPDKKGVVSINIKELERIEIHLTNASQAPCSHQFSGFQTSATQSSPLPIGSTLDCQKGIFYWQPGPGFTGTYHLNFFDNKEKVTRKISITISPGK